MQEALAYYIKPDILLIDEIENHMHPEYISLLIDVIKENIKQTIITSHHPHLIFSSYVNEVFYVESNVVLPEKNLLQKVKLPLNSGNHNQATKNMSPFPRTITNLIDDFEKITGVYHLFDDMDNSLIRMANSMSTKLNNEVLKYLEKAFNYPPITANKSQKPDLQSTKLISFLKSKISENDNNALQILDYGAGLGRTYLEVNKTVLLAPMGKHVWSLWEPYEKYRNELELKFQTIPTVNVLQNPLAISENSYDIVILANVLHECNPSDFTKIISHIHYALKDSGQLIIIELYPLIDSEKLAVAYSKEQMEQIFGHGTGWNIDDSEAVSIFKGSVTAYWLLIGKTKGYSKDEFYNNLMDVWKVIHRQKTMTYTQRKKLGTQFHLNALIHEMMTLASIASYGNKDWKDMLIEGYEQYMPNI